MTRAERPRVQQHVPVVHRRPGDEDVRQLPYRCGHGLPRCQVGILATDAGHDYS
jgi:hypothetical protein